MYCEVWVMVKEDSMFNYSKRGTVILVCTGTKSVHGTRVVLSVSMPNQSHIEHILKMISMQGQVLKLQILVVIISS